MSSIPHRPVFRLSPSFPPRKPAAIRNLSISQPRISFPKHIYSLRLHDKNNRICGQIRKRMTELTQIPALRSSDDIEGLEMMEQEAILSHGSSLQLPSDFGSGGLQSAINNSSKWLVAAIFGFAILWKHDVEALWAAMGCVLNAKLSVTLKRIFNQERPVANLRSDPGMPSSHAQSIFFAFVFAIQAMVHLLGFNGLTVVVGVLAVALASYLSWLRVSQKLHTISQVSVGAVIGTVFSILWFQAWYAFVLKAFVAFLPVRIVIVLVSVALCVRFLIYVVQYWLVEEP